MVVAPGCPAKLLQDLLGAGVLPGDTQVDVLLPSQDTRLYAGLLEGRNPAWSARILPSPGRHFFSPGHLYWLWENLWPSSSNLLLTSASPYGDLAAAVAVLSVLALSGKGIKVLFPEAATETRLTGPKAAGRWRTRELNARVLLQELGRLSRFPRVYQREDQEQPAHLKPRDS
jgi:hypothetical protein